MLKKYELFNDYLMKIYNTSLMLRNNKNTIQTYFTVSVKFLILCSMVRIKSMCMWE